MLNRMNSLQAKSFIKFLLSCAAVILAILNPQQLIAQNLAVQFADEFVAGNMSRPASLDWLPGGRALVSGLRGEIYLVDLGAGSSTLYFTVPSVDSTGEFGLLDIVVDNDFNSNGYFYVYYSQAPTSQLHIDRYRFTGNSSTDAASRTVIWTNPGPNPSALGRNHIGGSLNIGPDNKFYLSVGDVLNSATSQQMDNVFGKILRINKNGTAPTDNPFYNAANSNNVDEIWALGVRNPFRASFDQATGRYIFGDVGGNQAEQAYEEINIGKRGANYGWPMCEGPLSGPKNGPSCPAGIEGPILYYAHNPDGGCCQNAAVTGGEVVRGSKLPSQLQNAYVYADFAKATSRYLKLDAQGNVSSDFELKNILTPVWIGQAPDGHIYYIRFKHGTNGELRRLRYRGGGSNLPPVISSATASRNSGAAPLTVNFSASASDPDGDSISYLWRFGDGATSTSRNVSHTYTQQGEFFASLRVTAGGQSTNSPSIRIAAGAPPVARIDSPVDGSLFVAGQTISLRGSASDAGPLNNSSYVWNVLFAHGNHRHPALNNAVGRNLSYTIDDTGHDFSGDTSYIIELTVVNELGLAHTRSVEIEPRKVDFELSASDGVDSVTVDGITRSVPVALDTAASFRHEVAALAQGCLNDRALVFDSWSDGGALSHIVRVPSTASSLQANYRVPDTPLDAPLICDSAPIPMISLPEHGSITEVSDAGPVVAIEIASSRNLTHAAYTLLDKSTGLYWNAFQRRYQTSVHKNYIGQVPSSVQHFESQIRFKGAATQGGEYQVRGWARDASGAEKFGPRKEFRLTAKDTDNDGMPDFYESEHGFNPNNPSDAEADADGDGLTNLQESALAGLDPREEDTDGDSLDDGFEVENGLDPLQPNECPNWLCHRTPGWLWSKGKD